MEDGPNITEMLVIQGQNPLGRQVRHCPTHVQRLLIGIGPREAEVGD